MNTTGSITHGMPAEQYFAIDAISNSLLSEMNRSPAHCWAMYISPERPPRKPPTPSMLGGTLAHCMILEPGAFQDRYTVRPEGIDLRTKAGKDWQATVQGEIITLEQMAACMRQREAVLAVPELHHALSSGQAEVTLQWVDPVTGLACKARPDWIHTLPDGRVIVLDLKTTSDVSPEQFGRSVWNFGYHRQAAHYTAGLRACGLEVAAFLFAAVTNEYPFIAVPYMLDEVATQRGVDDVRRLIDAFAQCKAESSWPAFGEGVQVLSLPAWVK